MTDPGQNLRPGFCFQVSSPHFCDLNLHCFLILTDQPLVFHFLVYCQIIEILEKTLQDFIVTCFCNCKKMAQTVQLAPLPCLQIGPSWMSYILHQNRCEVSLEVFPHRSDKQHTVPAPILQQAHPSVPRETVEFKMCKRCKTV